MSKNMEPINCIFHEKQEGSLCAQHCLNALLQEQYFSPVDLAEIARQLDETEREQMAEGGILSAEYRQFIEQPSGNLDDSGFFSIQVLTKALSVWGLDLVPFNSTDEIAARAREQPVQQSAFICNFREHWFTIRKLGLQWFNLNSLLTGPELISDTYLAMFLTQLQQEGYCIFVIIGVLPSCDADEILKVIRIEQPIKPSLINEKQTKSVGVPSDTSTSASGASGPEADEDNNGELQRALDESRFVIDSDDKVLQRTLAQTRADEEDDQLERALQLSMMAASELEDSQGEGTTTNRNDNNAENLTPNLGDLREKRLAFLNRLSGSQAKPPDTGPTHEHMSPHTGQDMTEAEMLNAALQMSLEQPK